MSALEKAARSILDELPRFVGEPYPGKSEFEVSYIDCGEVDLRDLARAVLMAVRSELSPSVVKAGCVVIEECPMYEDGDPRWTDGLVCFTPAAEQTFTAMIDAILNEGEEK